MLVQKRKEKTLEINTQKQQEQQVLDKQLEQAPEMLEQVKQKVKLDSEEVMDEEQLKEAGSIYDASLQEAEDSVGIERENMLASPAMERLSMKSTEALKNREVLKENINAVSEVVQKEKQAEAEKEERKEKKLLVPDLKVFEDCLSSLQKEKGERSDSFNNVKDALAEFIELAKTETQNGRAVSDALLKVRKAGVAYYNSHRGHRSWLFGGHRRKETVEKAIKACEDYILSDSIEASMKRYIIKDIKNDPEETGEKNAKKKKFFTRAVREEAPYLKERFDDVSYGILADKRENYAMIEYLDDIKSKLVGKGKDADTGFKEFARMAFLVKDYIKVNGEPASPEDKKIEEENIALFNKFYSNNIEDRRDVVNTLLERVLEFEFRPEMLTMEYIREHYGEIYRMGICVANYQNVIESDPLNYAAFMSLTEKTRTEATKKADMLNAMSHLAIEVSKMHNISTQADDFVNEEYCHPIDKAKSPDWLKDILPDFENGIQSLELAKFDSFSHEELDLQEDYSLKDYKKFSRVEEQEDGKTKITGMTDSYWEALITQMSFIQNSAVNGEYNQLAGKTLNVNWRENNIGITEKEMDKSILSLSPQNAEKLNVFTDKLSQGMKPEFDKLKERASALKDKGAAANALIESLEKISERMGKVLGMSTLPEKYEICHDEEAEKLIRQYLAVYASLETCLENDKYSKKTVKPVTDESKVFTPYNVFAEMFEEQLLNSKDKEEIELTRKEILEEQGEEALKFYDMQTAEFEKNIKKFAAENCKANPVMTYREARTVYVRRKSSGNTSEIVFTPEVVDKMQAKYSTFIKAGNQNRVFECRCKSVYLNEEGQPATKTDEEHLQYNKAMIDAYLEGNVENQEKTMDDIVDFYTETNLPYEKLLDPDYMFRHYNDEWYLMASRYSLATDQINQFEHHTGFFNMDNLEKRYGKEKAEKFKKRSDAVGAIGAMLDSYIAVKHGLANTGQVSRVHGSSANNVNASKEAYLMIVNSYREALGI